MNFMAIHNAVMYLMAAILLVATWVIVERIIYFISTEREGRRVGEFMKTHLHDVNLHHEILAECGERRSPQAQAMCEIVNASQLSHDETEYFVQSVYVAKQSVLHARLWILDTVITLSPLLGLLGTILGIIDAFYNLSSGNGSSDPAAVSRGIGTALYATGFGIFIALYSLVFFNYFNSKVEAINGQIKLLALTYLSSGRHRERSIRRDGEPALQAVKS